MTERLTGRLRLRVPPSLAPVLDTEARRRMVSRSAYVRMVLAEHLEQIGKNDRTGHGAAKTG